MRRYLMTITSVMAFAFILLCSNGASAADNVEITNANFYAAWGMSTLQNVEIANNSSSSITNPEIEIRYNNSYSNQIQVAKITLPIEVPPHSKGTYLKEGLNKLIVNSGGNAGMHTGKSEIKLKTIGKSVNVVSVEVLKSDLNS